MSYHTHDTETMDEQDNVVAVDRCSAECDKTIPHAGRCQSQCDQRVSHSGPHNCPTHGGF